LFFGFSLLVTITPIVVGYIIDW